MTKKQQTVHLKSSEVKKTEHTSEVTSKGKAEEKTTDANK